MTCNRDTLVVSAARLIIDTQTEYRLDDTNDSVITVIRYIGTELATTRAYIRLPCRIHIVDATVYENQYIAYNSMREQVKAANKKAMAAYNKAHKKD